MMRSYCATLFVMVGLGAMLLLIPSSAVYAQTPSPPVPRPVPSPSPRPVPSRPGAPSADRTVVGASTIAQRTFVAVLRAANSPMAREADGIYQRCTAANVDCAFLLAIARKEAQYAVDPQWIGNYNWGNLRCGIYERCFTDAAGNRWRQYTSFVEATDDWLANLQAGYLSQGLTTVATILPKYAPPTDGNDTPGYIRQVLQWMEEWGRGQAQPTPPPTTNGWGSDSLFRAPMDGFTYDQVQAVTSLLWHLNAGSLRTTATLAQIGDRVTLTFGDILQFLGSLLQSTATQLIALGLAFAAVGLLLLPLVGRQTLVSVRAVPWLLLIVLGGFPSAGVAYLTVEGLQRNIANTTYLRLFEATDGSLRGEQPTGTGGNLGTITPLFSNSGGRHALDVAAAYLMVARTDLEQDTALPEQFKKTFFPNTSEALEGWARPVRAEVYATAWRGMERMLSGTIFVALAAVEELIYLTTGTSLGILSLALLVTLAFAIFTPILRVVDAVGRQLWLLFIGSVIVSAVQAILLALVFWRASLDLPAQVVVWGGIALVLESILLVIIVLGVLYVFWQAGKSTLRWRVLAGGATLTQTIGARLPQQWQQVRRPSFAPLRAAFGSVAGGVVGGFAASRFGASRQAALAYGFSGSKAARAVGTAALAAGVLPIEWERGLQVGAIGARGKPLGLHGLLHARRAFARQREDGKKSDTRQSASSQTTAAPSATAGAPHPHPRSTGRSRRGPSQWRAAPKTGRTPSQAEHAPHNKDAHDIELMAMQYERAGLHAKAQALRLRARRLQQGGTT